MARPSASCARSPNERVSRPGRRSYDDLRRLARRRVPRGVFDFVDGGAGAEVTLRENRAAFERVRFDPRWLSDVSQREIATTVLGERVAMPVLLAPAGLARLVHPEGELAAARAAGAAGDHLLRLDRVELLDRGDRRRRARGRSGCSSTSGAALTWSRAWSARARRPAIPRARAHGRRAGRRQPRARRPQRGLAATPDPARHGPRRADAAALAATRSSAAPTITFANLGEIAGSSDPGAIGPYVDRELNDPTGHLGAVDWLRRLWDGPLVVKGVLSVRDAEEAVRRGADAVYVSNHGGRQLDGSPATLDVLAGRRRGRRRHGPRSCSTEASAAARTSSRRARSAPAPASSVGPGSWASPPAASAASRACSTCWPGTSTGRSRSSGCRGSTTSTRSVLFDQSFGRSEQSL